jgi:hypothetical protein
MSKSVVSTKAQAIERAYNVLVNRKGLNEDKVFQIIALLASNGITETNLDIDSILDKYFSVKN